VTLRTFIYARGSKLTNLILSNCHITTKSVLLAIARTCQYLVDLDLSNCHIINTGSFGILSKLTNLQQLNLYRTQVGNGELKLMIVANKGLQSLKLGSCPRINGDDICLCLSLHSKELKILDLWRCHSITSKGILHLCTLNQLRDLDLGWCNNILAVTECIQTLVSSCTQLQRLLLSAHRQTSDLDIEAISRHLGSELLQFSCMGSRNITTQAMLNLAAHCHNLQLLDFSYCENLENATFHRELCSILPKCHVVTSINGS